MKLEYLQLNHYKGFQNLRLEGLGRVNLVIGGNNTGKTSVLEAICLLCGDQQQLVALPGTFRQQVTKDIGLSFWRMLALEDDFTSFQVSSNVSKVEAIIPYPNMHLALFRVLRGVQIVEHEPLALLNKENQFRISNANTKSFPRLSILPTSQPDPLVTSRLFNEIAPMNPENEMKLEVLIRQSIEPRLRRLRYAKPKGAHEHLVYADLGNGPMIPFTQMGQAFARVLHIYCEIFALQPDILLVDEIENGLYYRGLPDFWKGLIAVLEDQNVQLVATTHSRECMEAACNANQGTTSLRYLRLDRRVDDPENIVGTVFDDTTMAAALEAGQEMR